MNTEKDSAKTNRDLLVRELENAGAVGTNRKHIKCPYHDDKSPSAEIRQAKGSGNWNFYCYTCNISADVFELRARNEGRDVGDILKEEFPRERTSTAAGNYNTRSDGSGMYVMPPPTQTASGASHTNQGRQANGPKASSGQQTARKPGVPTCKDLVGQIKQSPLNHFEAIYPYTDPESGETDFAVIRYVREGKKQVLPASKDPQDGLWRLERLPDPLPLYNRTGIINAETVVFVEGEKCVDFFENLKLDKTFCAATNCGGSGAISKADLTPLAGKTVCIWRDFDEQGEKWEKELIPRLLDLEPFCSVFRVRVEDLGLKAKDDIVDFWDSLRGSDDARKDIISKVIEGAENRCASSAAAERLKSIEEGKFKHIPFVGMPTLNVIGQFMLPETSTMLVANQGAGKSMLIGQWLNDWVNGPNPIKVRALFLEGSEDQHIYRFLTQIANNSKLSNTDYQNQFTHLVRTELEKHHLELEKMCRSIRFAGGEIWDHAEILAWISEQAKNKADVIIIDPITAAKPTREPWIKDQEFILATRKIIQDHKCRIIIVTHPRSGNISKPSLGGVAGGMAFTRFADNACWLSSYPEPQSGIVEISGYSVPKTYDRSITINKSRYGSGTGRTIGYNFDPATFKLVEVGNIKPDDVKKGRNP